MTPDGGERADPRTSQLPATVLTHGCRNRHVLQDHPRNVPRNLERAALCHARRMATGDDPRFALTREPGFNRLTWSPDVSTISGEDVQATADAFDAVFGPDRRPLLVEIGALTRITPDARQMLIEGTHPTRVAVLSTDMVTRVITAFAYTSMRPTRFFTDETEATAWLLDPRPEAEAEAEQDPGGGSDPSA